MNADRNTKMKVSINAIHIKAQHTISCMTGYPTMHGSQLAS